MERAAASLPRDWAYASLNVHETVCREDAVNDDWFLKRSASSLLGAERVFYGHCEAVRLDRQWASGSILHVRRAGSFSLMNRSGAAANDADSSPTNRGGAAST